MVKDIRAGAIGSYPVKLTNVNGTLFFVANDIAMAMKCGSWMVEANCRCEVREWLGPA